MAYSCRSSLEARFGVEEISQLVDDLQSPDETLCRLISDADALIDSYSGAYQLPFPAPVPALVQSLSADITRYRLWDDRAPAEVRKRYEDALALLKDIAKGTVKLPASSTVVASSTYGGIIATTTRDRTFSDDSLGSFVGRGDLSWPPRTD